MIFGAILAGGTGSRMKLDTMPKQFLPLGDKPIFLHTVEKFLLVESIDEVYLGVHPDWLGEAQRVLTQAEIASRVKLVTGGGDRNSTIFNIVDAIESAHPGEDHVIVTHDAVRPFVTARIIEDNIAAAKEFGGCDTVIPATDTIVEGQGGEFVSAIPNRAVLYQGQTPQSFKISVLKQAFDELSDDDRAVLTDACKALVLTGHPVKLVEGADSNIKLTTVMDYNVARALVHRLDEETRD